MVVGKRGCEEMFEIFNTDVIENDLLQMEKNILNILLFDRSTRRNIIWATDDYISLGSEYQREAEMLPALVTGEHTLVIQPRTSKSVEEQQNRVRVKAEVFTPAWVCNQQNNLIDEAWFGRKDVFNSVDGTVWTATEKPIFFPANGSHTWKRYVDAKRLEISCGEAPYLVSRYDATTGTTIPLQNRIGLLDRKLRVVNENAVTKNDWIIWAIRAVQSVYGFEFQGDNLLLARENMFITFLEYYNDRYHELPDKRTMEKAARIVSWNLWQMDALKGVVPYSCKPIVEEYDTLFGIERTETPCAGCKDNNILQQTGVYCRIMDWRAKQSVRYVDMLKGGKKHVSL